MLTLLLVSIAESLIQGLSCFHTGSQFVPGLFHIGTIGDNRGESCSSWMSAINILIIAHLQCRNAAEQGGKIFRRRPFSKEGFAEKKGC
ncbi:uncharacterized protein LY79DRAFT_570895 [Colletotrichum navitas]|uniref:Secreted protein n=1 Tax=Colletotrichum navitas TaxID=681940 RepID=A0AAD8UWY2_9PEZI|nr:uncharacterized protein LY79DRAFT_570895 [Colletotrichum navitas]KAK1569910.1 hypothetical protein LY79DRAFT_570895 [Colletotrichum navitas]